MIERTSSGHFADTCETEKQVRFTLKADISGAEQQVTNVWEPHMQSRTGKWYRVEPLLLFP